MREASPPAAAVCQIAAAPSEASARRCQLIGSTSGA
jgi:hypothetical protein